MYRGVEDGRGVLEFRLVSGPESRVSLSAKKESLRNVALAIECLNSGFWPVGAAQVKFESWREPDANIH
jgi:hypothetical protein